MEVKTDMAQHTQSFITSSLYLDESLGTKKKQLSLTFWIDIFLIQSRQKVQMSQQGKKSPSGYKQLYRLADLKGNV